VLSAQAGDAKAWWHLGRDPPAADAGRAHHRWGQLGRWPALHGGLTVGCGEAVAASAARDAVADLGEALARIGAAGQSGAAITSAISSAITSAGRRGWGGGFTPRTNRRPAKQPCVLLPEILPEILPGSHRWRLWPRQGRRRAGTRIGVGGEPSG
jgi:hypothetical protein